METRLAAAFRAALLVMVACLSLLAGPARAAERPDAGTVVREWYGLVLELVRHTPTYSPPVASRAFGYLGVTAFEAAAGGDPAMVSLAGQLNGLTAPPVRTAGAVYDEAVVAEAALQAGVKAFFANTGPTGQRAMRLIGERLSSAVAAGLPEDVVARSRAHGQAVAAHVLAWSQDDGGAVITNMGFPDGWEIKTGDANWRPTSLVRQQQAPLLPAWGENRPFAMPDGATCGLPPPPDYSTDPESAFFKEMMEVYEVSKSLTPEQIAIARFWSDDPMLSPTPPGHWVFIALDLLEAEKADFGRSAEVLARLGIAIGDAFIGCWHAKYEFDYVRPVTVIRKLVDPKWEPRLITPPFPEYPSGHSTQSGAAAAVLAESFGADFAFVDRTHEDDGMAPRAFPNFAAAAEEAALSRLYGGIHFRAAIERGLEQGRCVGAFATRLTMRR